MSRKLVPTVALIQVVEQGNTVPKRSRRIQSSWLNLPCAVVAVLVTLVALGMFAGADRR